MTDEMEVAIVNMMTSEGPQLTTVDLLLLTKPTKRRPPPDELLEEMRVAALQRRTERR